MEKEEIDNFSIYEVPREIFVIEPPLELVTHSMEEVYRQCQQPYYNNKRGCPNFGVKETCPPNFGVKKLGPKDEIVRHITEKYDINTLHLLILKFDFDLYMAEKKEIHPDWTNRALANQRHWQSHLRSQTLKFWEQEVSPNYEGYELERCPEGRGINLIETLENNGVQVDWCKEDENHEFVSYPEFMYYVYVFGQPLKEIDQ
jgi:predicted metal-binding protein